MVSHEDIKKIKITWFYYNTGRTWETPKQLLSPRTEWGGGREATVRSSLSSNKFLSQDCSTLGAERHPFVSLSPSCRKTAATREMSADDNSRWCMPGTVPEESPGVSGRQKSSFLLELSLEPC